MKRNRIWMGIVLACLFGAWTLRPEPTLAGVVEFTSASAAAADSGSAPPPVNFNAIALLRWYHINLTTTVAVGANPVGIAFDGANMWVANFNDNPLTKVRGNDGAVLGTFKVGT